MPAKVGLTWQSKQIERMTEQALQSGLTAAAKIARRSIKAEIRPGDGSEPGQAPDSQSGALRKAIQYRVKRRRGRYVVVDVGVLLPSSYDSRAKGKAFRGRMHAQAMRLERGFVGTDRLGRTYEQRPRPFVTTVLKRDRRALGQVVEQTARRWAPKPKQKK